MLLLLLGCTPDPTVSTPATPGANPEVDSGTETTSSSSTTSSPADSGGSGSTTTPTGPGFGGPIVLEVFVSGSDQDPDALSTVGLFSPTAPIDDATVTVGPVGSLAPTFYDPSHGNYHGAVRGWADRWEVRVERGGAVYDAEFDSVNQQVASVDPDPPRTYVPFDARWSPSGGAYAEAELYQLGGGQRLWLWSAMNTADDGAVEVPAYYSIATTLELDVSRWRTTFFESTGGVEVDPSLSYGTATWVATVPVHPM